MSPVLKRAALPPICGLAGLSCKTQQTGFCGTNAAVIDTADNVDGTASKTKA